MPVDQSLPSVSKPPINWAPADPSVVAPPIAITTPPGAAPSGPAAAPPITATTIPAVSRPCPTEFPLAAVDSSALPASQTHERGFGGVVVGVTGACLAGFCAGLPDGPLGPELFALSPAGLPVGPCKLPLEPSPHPGSVQGIHCPFSHSPSRLPPCMTKVPTDVVVPLTDVDPD